MRLTSTCPACAEACPWAGNMPGARHHVPCHWRSALDRPRCKRLRVEQCLIVMRTWLLKTPSHTNDVYRPWGLPLPFWASLPGWPQHEQMFAQPSLPVQLNISGNNYETLVGIIEVQFERPARRIYHASPAGYGSYLEEHFISYHTSSCRCTLHSHPMLDTCKQV